MKIRYTKDAVKFLDKQDKKSVKRIKTAIEGLLFDPPIGDIKVMQGYKDGRRRLRVGKFRVVYRYGAEGKIDVLLVLEIGNRGDIYK